MPINLEIFKQIGSNKELLGNPELKRKVRELHATFREFLIWRFMGEGSSGAEVGVDHGDFAQKVVDICNPSTYYLIDPWIVDNPMRQGNYERVLSRFSKQIEEGQVRTIKDFGVNAAASIPNNSLDWVYIDCSHSLKDVTDNIHAYAPKVKRGGYIMGDDYVGKNVYRGFHEYANANKSTIKITLADDKIANQIVLQKV